MTRSTTTPAITAQRVIVVLVLVALFQVYSLWTENQGRPSAADAFGVELKDLVMGTEEDTSSQSPQSPLLYSRQRPPSTHLDCVLFFHIPKTGGSSFSTFLRQLARDRGWTTPEWYEYWSRFHNRTPPAASYKINHKVLHLGHLTPVFYNLTNTQHCVTVTILREPVDRVISAFYYHNHKTPEWSNCLQQPLPDSSSCAYAAQYQNDGVRLFSDQSTWNSYDYETYKAAPVTRQSLQAAKQFLVDMDLVCFLPDLDACQDHLLTLLRPVAAPIAATVAAAVVDDTDHKFYSQTMTTDRVDMPVRNVNPRRPTRVSNATLAAIKTVNQLDIDLYAWAAATFGNTQE